MEWLSDSRGWFWCRICFQREGKKLNAKSLQIWNFVCVCHSKHVKLVPLKIHWFSHAMSQGLCRVVLCRECDYNCWPNFTWQNGLLAVSAMGTVQEVRIAWREPVGVLRALPFTTPAPHLSMTTLHSPEDTINFYSLPNVVPSITETTIPLWWAAEALGQLWEGQSSW